MGEGLALRPPLCAQSMCPWPLARDMGCLGGIFGVKSLDGLRLVKNDAARLHDGSKRLPAKRTTGLNYFEWVLEHWSLSSVCTCPQRCVGAFQRLKTQSRRCADMFGPQTWVRSQGLAGVTFSGWSNPCKRVQVHVPNAPAPQARVFSCAAPGKPTPRQG